MRFVSELSRYMLPIEIIYIEQDQAICHICLKVPNGTTVQKAIELSGLISYFPEVSNLAYAIFGQIVDQNASLKTNDRIEILRPLTIDPMTKRRQRAQHR